VDRLPKGNRVAIMVASGGFGVLLADAACAAGLAVPEATALTQARVTGIVPLAAPRNPIDATAQMSSRPDIMQNLLFAILEDDSFDTLIVLVSSALYLPRLRTVYMQALAAARVTFPDRVVALCVHGPADAVAELGAMGFPATDGVDACTQVVAGLAGLRAALDAPRAIAETLPSLPALPPRAELMSEHGAKRALAAAGLPVLPEVLAGTPGAAAEAAAAMGFPVVLKIVSPDLPHKTEVGGVALNLASADAVRAAAALMLERVRAAAPTARLEGLLVAPMVSGGVELILGTTQDPVFGPVVMAGLGGIYAEILRDVAVRPAPVSHGEARDMLRSLKAWRLLEGARGTPPADIVAACDAIVALSCFAAVHRDTISAIDVNPLLVRPQGQGAVALDALIVPSPEIAHAA
jgi:acyl-CoA synthetase (NDP forming)